MVSRRQRPGSGQSEQWVLLAPESLSDDAKNLSDKTIFAKLRAPCTDKGSMFLFIDSGQQICEVKAFHEEYRSWFIGQTVQQDGRLLIATPIDPMFLVLHYLIKADKEQGKFQPVEQIVVDEEFPSCSMLLQCTPVSKSLHHVTEEKGKFTKTCNWLGRVELTVKVLKSSNICVGGGVQSATFIRNTQGSDVKEEDYTRYAHGLISEYLTEDLREDLSNNFLTLTLQKRKVSEAPVEAEEDYTKFNSDSKNKKSNSKMTAAQKSLAKVDKSGMKNISAFFSPKAKATK
uniref:Ribonuclease H2 subunit B n=1 Tax=Xenopus tropicalis TaxID=8364 RepID=A0A803JXD0_XENTR